MRSAVLAITIVALISASGCTHHVLMRSMIHQASTVMDIEYQMVLDNLAMFECNPSALPWHVRIKDGVVQVNDQAGIEGLGVQWGATSNFTRGPQALRSVTEQWGADAVTNPRIVKKLQDVYREAIGLPPEPDPDFFTQVAQANNQPRLRQPNSAKQPEEESGAEEIPPPQGVVTDDSQPPAQWPDYEVPVGWFHTGRKGDVPRDACYVGHYCDSYVWVTHRGEPGLSRFTLTILSITSSDAKTGVQRGLAFTR